MPVVQNGFNFSTPLVPFRVCAEPRATSGITPGERRAIRVIVRGASRQRMGNPIFLLVLGVPILASGMATGYAWLDRKLNQLGLHYVEDGTFVEGPGQSSTPGAVRRIQGSSAQWIIG